MRVTRSRSRAGAAALLTIPLLLAGLVAGAPAGAESQATRVTLPGGVPDWAGSAADRGPVADSAAVTAHVYLAGRDRAGLAALAHAVSDPRSSTYGQYLTAGQVQQRFGVTARQRAAVRAWLTGAGFRVTTEDAHELTVLGDARAVRLAFRTELHAYRRGGRVYSAPVVRASVPASVAADVLAVTGLDNAPHLVHHDGLRAVGAAAVPDRTAPADDPAGHGARRDILPGPGPAYVNSGPFSSSFGQRPATSLPRAYGHTQPYALAGYTGTQLRRAYGATAGGLTGTGVTIAIVDAYDSPTLGQDVTRYAAAHGDAAYRKGQLTRVDPAQWTDVVDPSPAFPNGCGASGWYGEQTLDIEAAHAMAPDANLVYVGAASCGDDDLVGALNRIVDGHLADIVSDSWSSLEGDTDSATDAVYNHALMGGAAEGIGFYFSSGDHGDDLAATGTKQVETPAALPWATAVGGTSLATDADGTYRFETGWGTAKAFLAMNGRSWSQLPGGFDAGGGGGTSRRSAEPDYQQHVVPAALAGIYGGHHRVVPDVAAVADSGTGFLVGQTQTWPDNTVRYGEYRIGGTSLAAPVFAGIQALAQQASGKPLGFANPALYQRYGTVAYHQVTDHPLGAGTELAQVRVDYRNAVDATGGLSTTLRTMGHDSSLHATVGYNDVTGVGTPAAGYLTSYLPTH
ncbi:protease pro-enzyme activation domain-containing protein [Streptacidiphilus sp. EB129]|uniref:S53 family peptidase n=1 Tax=Streptacidiphilus sp. EB129 TaxID=3156262 RepID=UPI003512BE8A